MARAKNVVITEVSASAPQRKLFAIEPWRYRLLDNRQTAVIEAYVEMAGARKVIARVQQSRWLDADRTARHITDAVNALQSHDATIEELCSALELCLECDDLSWEAEIEAEQAVKRARQKRLRGS